MEGARVPSLVSLCIEATSGDLLRGTVLLRCSATPVRGRGLGHSVTRLSFFAGDELLSDVYELPSDLFDQLLMRSPPLVLQKLHSGMLVCQPIAF